MLQGHQFQNEIDPAIWVLKTASYIARRKQLR